MDRGITLLDEHPTEERYVTFGTDAEGRVLAVSYALRGNSIRIIKDCHGEVRAEGHSPGELNQALRVDLCAGQFG
jgi:hypothetical protein